MKFTCEKIKKIVLFVLLLGVSNAYLFSQSLPPHLNGEGLKDWMKTNYYEGTHTELGYSTARMYMYGYIDNDNNTLRGVYSGYTMPWSYGSTGTNPAPINCEHTVPQSFFNSDEPMRSDIHHLYPTYGSWNSVRSNYPFTDITDTETTKWMYLDTDQTNIPTSNIDLYSESKTLEFEPREDHKGNTARSVFYFYTMYPTQAGNINACGDPNVLYQWHLQDPADANEIQRNDGIEQYQGNRNPYVDFSEAVERAWLLNLNSNVPTAPANFSLGSSANALELTWQDAANETGYYIYRSSDLLTYSQIGNLGANTTSYSDVSVTEGQEYGYYVVPYNASGTGQTTLILSGQLGSTPPTGGNGQISDLLFSEYIEGSSYNKGLEIANYTGNAVDLSIYDIRKQTNGAGSWSSPFTLSGQLANTEVFVVVHSSAATEMLSAANINTNNSIITFNGNDAVGLFKNGVLIDIIGVFNSAANFAIDVTLVRNSDITDPNTTYTTSEWTSYSTNDFSHLGFHTVDVSDPCATSGGDGDGDGVCANVDCNDNDASLPASPGTSCNDGNATTENDVIQSDGCTCAGTLIPCINEGGDADGDGICADVDCNDNDASLPASPGTSCNDGNATTENDVIQSDGCTCAGTLIPCINEGGDADGDGICADVDCNDNDASLPASPGTSCNDGDATTENDVIQSDGCTCAGTPTGGGGCTYSVVNSQNFESGWGLWNDGGSDCRRSSNDASYANSGTYCVRLRDNSGNASAMYTDNLDLTAYEEITLSYSFIARSMDNSNEDFMIELSNNGGASYTTIAAYAKGVDFENNIRYSGEEIISGPFSSSTRLQIRCDASANNDQVYVDDVVISGCSSTSNLIKEEQNTVVNSTEAVTRETTSYSLDPHDKGVMNVYPNPIRNELNIAYELAQAGTVQFLITDLNGRRVLSEQLQQEKGAQISTLNTSSVSEGIYLVHLITNNSRIVQKIMVSK